MIHLSTCEALLMTKHKYAKLKQSFDNLYPYKLKKKIPVSLNCIAFDTRYEQ